MSMRVSITASSHRRGAHCFGRLPHAAPPSKQSGIALIAVLWLTVLLTVIASGFAFSMRTEALAARNYVSLAQARASADGAIERTLFELQRPRSMNDVWVADGEPHKWQEADAAIASVAVDESAKIDLNTAADALLKGLLQQVGGMEAESAQHLVEAIADWRDADELRRPNGAEEPEYRAAGLKYRPSNGAFDTVGELQRVLGMTPELFARISDSLTVYSRQPGINTATAARNVLLALPNVTPEMVDAYIQQRDEARLNKLPIPPFPGAQGFAGGAIPVWRIRTEAIMPDGVTFVREAVVRPSLDQRRPMLALLWQQGARITPYASPGEKPADEQADATKTGSSNR
jgi:general secretion pathway protein K